MVGGAEVMSRPSLALTAETSKRLTDLFGRDPAAALSALQSLTPRDFRAPNQRGGPTVSPVGRWAITWKTAKSLACLARSTGTTGL